MSRTHGPFENSTTATHIACEAWRQIYITTGFLVFGDQKASKLTPTKVATAPESLIAAALLS